MLLGSQVGVRVSMFSTIDREVLIVFGSLLLLLSKNYDRDTGEATWTHRQAGRRYRGGKLRVHATERRLVLRCPIAGPLRRRLLQPHTIIQPLLLHELFVSLVLLLFLL